MSFKALSWAWEANTGSPGRKLVMVGLAQFANDKDECWPSQQTIAERTEQSERTVREHLAWLEEAGFLTRQARSSKGNRYDSDVIKLHLDRLEPKANEERKPAANFAAGDPPPENSASGEKPHVPAANFAGHQRQISPPNLHMNPQFESPDNPPTPQGGKDRKRKVFDPTEFDTLIPLHFQTPEFAAKWRDWMEDLKERRIRLTERAAKGHLEHLVGKARTPAVARSWLQNAIDKGWRFPYEPRESGGVPPKPSARDSVNDSLRAQLAARQAQRGPANDADALF